MSESYNPESQLIDALYTLHRIPEQTDFKRDIAIIGGELREGCGVYRDLKTGNRIVMTDLPLDPIEFVGALVSISHPDEKVKLSVDGRELSLSEVEIDISPTLESRLTSPDLEDSRVIPILDLLKLVEFPSINPIPVDDEDPRQLPIPISQLLDPPEGKEYLGQVISRTDFDILATPHGLTYTKLASIMDPILDAEPEFDDDIASVYNVEATLDGILNDFDGDSLGYKVVISEDLPVERDFRATDFDRRFDIEVSCNRAINLEVKLIGSSTIVNVTGEVMSFLLQREGLILNAYVRGIPNKCIPEYETLKFLEKVILNGSHL